MTNIPANDQLLDQRAEQLILLDQLKRAELFSVRVPCQAS